MHGTYSLLVSCEAIVEASCENQALSGEILGAGAVLNLLSATALVSCSCGLVIRKSLCLCGIAGITSGTSSSSSRFESSLRVFDDFQLFRR